jgi:dipeptidyl-peptidase-4
MKSFTSILFLFFIVLSANSQNINKEITLEDIWKNKTFSAKNVRSFRSMQNDEFYTILNQGKIEKYSYSNGELIEVLLSDSLLVDQNNKSIEIGDYEFSNSEKNILIETEAEPIYRHSYYAKYYLYNTENKSITPLCLGSKQRNPIFSPDDKKIAFIRDNNMYIYYIDEKREQQITFDGELNKIINGAPDWVYEEEFSYSRAMEWSANSNYLAFVRFDESKVKEFSLNFYGELYPEKYNYKYPKAGENNSLVSVHIFNLSSNSTRTVDIGADTNIYIPRIQWTNDADILLIQRLNRLQNQYDLLLSNQATQTTQLLLSESNKYYIDINDRFYFTKDKKSIILTSEKDGYNHIYQYDMKGKLVKQLTQGKYDVTSIYGVDEIKKRVYFQAAFSSPINREIFFVSLKNGKTTQLSTKVGTNNATFTSNFKYYTLNYSNANQPPYISVNATEGNELYVLEDNSTLKSKLNEFSFSTLTFIEVPIENGINLQASIIKPLNFDSTKKYPVLMYVYGGPGSQTVTNSWGHSNFIWFQMLAQNGYIVVSVDNRGTGARGEEFKKMTYLQLGKYEVIDQINAAKFLGNQSFVDKDRIGIFGWSYGGYMSTLCMTKGADYFKAGIAVAPVTNWRYYDNIYTERFMRTPAENENGYDSNSPISHVSLLKGKYLLVHGDADDNVHVQNTMDLTTALISQDKAFEMFVYPNSNHGIYTGKNTRLHLYRKMTDFILTNL